MFFRPFPDGFVKIFNFAIFLPFCWQKCNKIPLLYRFVKSNKIDTSNLDPDPILAVQKGSRSRSDPLFRSFCLKRGGGCSQFFFYEVKYPLYKVSPYSQYTLLYVGFYHFHFHFMANCVWRYPHLS